MAFFCKVLKFSILLFLEISNSMHTQLCVYIRIKTKSQRSLRYRTLKLQSWGMPGPQSIQTWWCILTYVLCSRMIMTQQLCQYCTTTRRSFRSSGTFLGYYILLQPPDVKLCKMMPEEAATKRWMCLMIDMKHVAQ